MPVSWPTESVLRGIVRLTTGFGGVHVSLVTPSSSSHECNACKILTFTLPGRGLARWQRQDADGGHYMMTAVAIRWRRGATEEQLKSPRERLADISAARQVAWIDVLRDGNVAVYTAPHGVIPNGLPRAT
jgi:hypothetical protein